MNVDQDDWEMVTGWAPWRDGVLIRTEEAVFTVDESRWSEMVKACEMACDGVDPLDGCLFINRTTMRLKVAQ